MFTFVLIAIILGGAIVAYIKMPKDAQTKPVIKLIKFTTAIMALTLLALFTFAVIGSTTSIKLF